MNLLLKTLSNKRVMSFYELMEFTLPCCQASVNIFNRSENALQSFDPTLLVSSANFDSDLRSFFLCHFPEKNNQTKKRSFMTVTPHSK